MSGKKRTGVDGPGSQGEAPTVNMDGSNSWASWRSTLGSVGCLAVAQAAPKSSLVHCKSAVEDLGWGGGRDINGSLFYFETDFCCLSKAGLELLLLLP